MEKEARPLWPQKAGRLTEWKHWRDEGLASRSVKVWRVCWDKMWISATVVSVIARRRPSLGRGSVALTFWGVLGLNEGMLMDFHLSSSCEARCMEPFVVSTTMCKEGSASATVAKMCQLRVLIGNNRSIML